MPVLARGSTKNLVLKDQQWAFVRQLDRETAIVVMNNESKPASIDVPLAELELSPSVHVRGLLGVVASAAANANELAVSLPARSGEIFLVER
jgi:hypothetical protein